jgi:RNA polymerase sigma-70 factor (ECF subfamily)
LKGLQGLDIPQTSSIEVLPWDCFLGKLMNKHPVTNPSLLLSLRDGENQQAWNEFVEIYAPLIFGHCCNRGLQHADALDVTQEVLLTVSRWICRFEYAPSKGRFRHWLLKVTRSKLSNYFRALSRHRQLCSLATVDEEEMESDAWDTQLAEWERDYRGHLFKWAAARVRDEVTDSTWNAFVATTFEGMSHQEAASALGMSLGAVYVARSRVRTRLRQVLASREGHA